MHWADVIAKDVVENCDHPLIATGISPTGILHVGSLREAITGESVRSAVEAAGKEVKLIYLIDDFDPLRRRYTFLPEEFEKRLFEFVGRRFAVNRLIVFHEKLFRRERAAHDLGRVDGSLRQLGLCRVEIEERK